MPIHQIELTPSQSRFISKEVKSGRYQDERAVLEAGLKLLEQKKDRQAEKVKKLRSLIKAGTDQLEQGKYTVIDGEKQLNEFFQELSKKARQRVRSRK
ncbi:MAG: type II toxin-antitoxin system ParD family antitoxin [Gemmatales bacterium]